MPFVKAASNFKKDLDEVDISLFSAVSAWLRKRGKALRPKLTEEQRKQMMECFELMDADGSGAIDAQELGNAFKLLGLHVSKAEMKELLAEVDRDGSGELEFNEFLEVMTSTLQKMQEKAEQQRQHGQQAQQTGPQVPFALLATAYRRKRMMEGLLTGDKEVQMQMLQMAAEQQQQQLLQQREQERQLQQGSSSISTGMGGRAGAAEASPSPAAGTEAASSSGSSSGHASSAHQRRNSMQRLRQLPAEFLGHLRQRVGFRSPSSEPQALLQQQQQQQQQQELDPEDALDSFMIERPASPDPALMATRHAAAPKGRRPTTALPREVMQTPDRLRLDIKLTAAQRRSSLPTLSLPQQAAQLGSQLEPLQVPGCVDEQPLHVPEPLSPTSSSAAAARARQLLTSPSSKNSHGSRPGSPLSAKLCPLMQHEPGTTGQMAAGGPLEFGGLAGHASPPVPRSKSPARVLSSRLTGSRGSRSTSPVCTAAAVQAVCETATTATADAAAPTGSAFITHGRASLDNYDVWRSLSPEVPRASVPTLDSTPVAGLPGSNRSSSSNRASIEQASTHEAAWPGSGSGRVAAVLRASVSQLNGYPPTAVAQQHRASIGSIDGLWSGTAAQPAVRSSLEQVLIMPGAAAAAAAAVSRPMAAGGAGSRASSLELLRQGPASPGPCIAPASLSPGPKQARGMSGMWSFGRQSPSPGRRSIGDSTRARSSLDYSSPASGASAVSGRNIGYEDIVFGHELYSWPSKAQQ